MPLAASCVRIKGLFTVDSAGLSSGAGSSHWNFLSGGICAAAGSSKRPPRDFVIRVSDPRSIDFTTSTL